MKKNLFVLINVLIIIYIVALVCNYTYKWCGLEELFKTKISFLNWYGISMISSILLNRPDNNIFSNRKNDE